VTAFRGQNMVMLAPSLLLWYQRTTDAQWQNLADVRRVFPSADSVGNLTVFNIGGNKYRLITFIDYESQIVFTRNVLQYADYDKEKWKNDDWFKNS
jgi:mRNA interferase HigB